MFVDQDLTLRIDHQKPHGPKILRRVSRPSDECKVPLPCLEDLVGGVMIVRVASVDPVPLHCSVGVDLHSPEFLAPPLGSMPQHQHSSIACHNPAMRMLGGVSIIGLLPDYLPRAVHLDKPHIARRVILRIGMTPEIITSSRPFEEQMPVIAVTIIDVDVEADIAHAVGSIHQCRLRAGELLPREASNHEAGIARGAEGKQRMGQAIATVGLFPELPPG